jgi:hypothetical protein
LKRREFLEEFHEKQEQVSFSGNQFPIYITINNGNFQYTSE